MLAVPGLRGEDFHQVEPLAVQHALDAVVGARRGQPPPFQPAAGAGDVQVAHGDDLGVGAAAVAQHVLVADEAGAGQADLQHPAAPARIQLRAAGVRHSQPPAVTAMMSSILMSPTSGCWNSVSMDMTMPSRST